MLLDAWTWVGLVLGSMDFNTPAGTTLFRLSYIGGDLLERPPTLRHHLPEFPQIHKDSKLN